VKLSQLWNVATEGDIVVCTENLFSIKVKKENKFNEAIEKLNELGLDWKIDKGVKK
jgi:hypothetical protein